MANHDIDNFIWGLHYDPHQILAVAQDGDVSTQPLTTSRKEDHEVVVCKTTEHKLTKNLSEVAILSQAAAAFPGALLIADEQLQRGTPTPIGLPRGKLRMTLLIPGNLRHQPLDVDPTVSGVQLFLNQELEDWNKHTESNENHQNYGNAENTFVKGISSRKQYCGPKTQRDFSEQYHVAFPFSFRFLRETCRSPKLQNSLLSRS